MGLLKYIDRSRKQLKQRKDKRHCVRAGVRNVFEISNDASHDRNRTIDQRQFCLIDEYKVILLSRQNRSLGLNIMGGAYMRRNVLYNDPVMISGVATNGMAEKAGFKLYDTILQVNGHDLSEATHEEAVEAFRNATEPIVVHVLRKVHNTGGQTDEHHQLNSTEYHQQHVYHNSAMQVFTEPEMVSVATQTDDVSEEELYYMWLQQQQEFAAYDMLWNEDGDLLPPFGQGFPPSINLDIADFDFTNGMEYFDMGFDMEYEEVVLKRASSEEKVGLTLCYENHGSEEDEITDIFVSEIEANSIAALDGRIKEGDQILQINETEVHSRQDAIKLFSETGADIRLLIARQILPVDDGYLEARARYETMVQKQEQHVEHSTDAHFTSLPQREGSATDTLSTEQSKNDKDSGVGRTDDSLKTEESSEQDLADCTSPTAVCNGVTETHRSSNDSFTSHATTINTEEGGLFHTEDQLIKECDRFRQALEQRCGASIKEDLFKIAPSNGIDRVSESENGLQRVDSQSSLERELVALNKEMKQIELECQQIVEAHKKETAKCIAMETAIVPSQSSQDNRASPSRSVPRMGTRLDYAKQLQLQQEYPEPIWVMREPALTSTPVQHKGSLPERNGSVPSSDRSKIIFPLGGKNPQENCVSEKNEKQRKSPKQRRGDSSCTSAYHTSESCRNTPSMTLQLNSKGNGCISHKETNDKQREDETVSIDQSKCSVSKSMSNSSVNQITQTPEPPNGDNLQELYSQYADVMYTNQANLQHTIMLQQKLFQQKLSQQAINNQHQRHPDSVSNGCHSSQNGYSSNSARSSSKQKVQNLTQPHHYPENPQVASSRCEPAPLQSPYSSLRQMRDQQQQNQNDSCGTSNANIAMEWVVKRRADGSRYITRRPMRSKMLKERAKKISEERCGMTTDDDAMSELKVGRYWSKDERKRHLEKAKEYKRRKAEMLRARMETVRENEDQMKPSILELSQRKMMKHKSRKMYDDFTTVQEILAHGSRNSQAPSETGSHQSGVTPLLSVTTV